jgi:succinyl-CoA synthetase alpha subunit
MPILIDRDTRLLVQGITGREGSFHTAQCIKYGTKVVAGVTPGKGGTTWDGIPVFDTVGEAVRSTGANASMIFVPAPFAADAIMEAADEGIGLIVCITEGIPVLDMIRAKDVVSRAGVRLIGPNCPGVISPGLCKVGIMPATIHMPGPVGVISRSGTLTYEVVDQLSRIGIGQSTCVGIGGDPVVGMGFVDLLELFREDPQTEAVVIIGEIGGTAEEEAASYIKRGYPKPVVAFIAGQTAPPGRRMGHAGAIISGGEGGAQNKIRALEEANVQVATMVTRVGELVARAIGHGDSPSSSSS